MRHKRRKLVHEVWIRSPTRRNNAFICVILTQTLRRELVLNVLRSTEDRESDWYFIMVKISKAEISETVFETRELGWNQFYWLSNSSSLDAVPDAGR